MKQAHPMGQFEGGIDVWRENDDWRSRDGRYSDLNVCEHPECEAWVKNGAHTCREHRGWWAALQSGNDFESRMMRHRFITRLVEEKGYTPVEAVRVAIRIRAAWNEGGSNGP